MSTENLVSPIPANPGSPDYHAELAATAERELGAFLSAVRQRFSYEAASRAGDYWLEAFEAAGPHANQPHPDWRRITIAAASRLATLELRKPCASN
jgi:hypothetical protein